MDFDRRNGIKRALLGAGVGAVALAGINRAAAETIVTDEYVSVDGKRFTDAYTAVVGRSGNVDYLCDGVADDVQIQAAIDAVNAAGGGVVLIREGEYSISASIIGCDDLILSGSGQSTIFSNTAVTGINIFQISNINNVTLNNFRIEGGRATADCRGIRIYDDCNNIHINNIYVNDCLRQGIQTIKNTVSPSDIFISGCTINGCGSEVGEAGIHIYLSDRVFISNCKSIGNPADNGFYMAESTNCMLSNCYAEDNFAHGFRATPAGSVGVECTYTFTNCIAYNNVSGFLVQNAIIGNCISDSNGNYGIAEPKHCKISNSVICNNGENGIYTHPGVVTQYNLQVSNCDIFGNTDVTQGAIELWQTTHVMINGCSIHDNTGKGLYSINADYLTIGNNHFYGNSDTTLTLSGDNNSVINNLGFNPVGNFTAPSIPASTTPYTNAYGYPCMVSVYGGTVTDIAIDAVSTGQTSGVFTVPPGETITLTYSVAPTWRWYGL